MQNNSYVVEFDIAVGVEASGKGGAGIKVMGVNLGGEKEYKNSSVSRIKFNISIDPETKEELKKSREEVNRKSTPRGGGFELPP